MLIRTMLQKNKIQELMDIATKTKKFSLSVGSFPRTSPYGNFENENDFAEVAITFGCSNKEPVERIINSVIAVITSMR
ncbi:MAG: hypothetical protein WCX17_03115 [Parcubacteria group bacterium]|jgi:hypothetical protein